MNIFRDNPDKFNFRIAAGNAESSDHLHDAYFMQGILSAAFYGMFRGEPVNATRCIIRPESIDNNYLIIPVDQAEQVETRRPAVQELNPIREADSRFRHMLYDVHTETIITTQGISDSQDQYFPHMSMADQIPGVSLLTRGT